MNRTFIYGLYDGFDAVDCYFAAKDDLAASKQIFAMLSAPFFNGDRQFDDVEVRCIFEIDNERNENGGHDMWFVTRRVGTVKEIMLNQLGSHPVDGISVERSVVEDVDSENV